MILEIVELYALELSIDANHRKRDLCKENVFVTIDLEYVWTPSRGFMRLLGQLKSILKNAKKWFTCVNTCILKAAVQLILSHSEVDPLLWLK